MSFLAALNSLPITNNVVILVGPDNDADGYFLMNGCSLSNIVINAAWTLTARGMDYTLIGNGLPDSAIDLSKFNKTIAAQPEGALVLILAHGEEIEGNHLLSNSKATLEKFMAMSDDDIISNLPFSSTVLPFVPSVALLQAIAQTGKKMNVVMASCQSGVLHKEADKILPKGSTFTTFSVDDNNVSRFTPLIAFGPDRLGKSIIGGSLLRNGNLSFKKLLESILSDTDADDNLSHTITIAGQGTYNLSALIADHLGRPFTRLEEFYIRNCTEGFDPVKDPAAMRDIQNGTYETKPATKEHAHTLAMLLAGSRGQTKPKLLEKAL